MRFAVDVGGTFSDLVIDDGPNGTFSFKAPTDPANPTAGVLAAIALAAEHFGCDRRALLGRGEIFIHATTRALNALLTGTTARTAFLTTAGHPDILLFREGGRSDLFDYTRPFPDPYVPRSLTFEVNERVWSDGRVVKALSEDDLDSLIDRLAAADVEAVAVSLLWSIINPVHELAIGERLARRLPHVAVTLSHQLNPVIREYRRASATCIDASLKPVMGPYLRSLDASLREAGYAGRILGVTSQGGVVDTELLALAPIHALNSGPSLAPLAGRAFAEADCGSRTAIVTDSGGTSFDVSLVRGGEIPRTAETWIGPRFIGHMVGFPSVEVHCIGAGGGSIASVDSGGLLHVGPASAGADPGPVCYGKGGTRPTVTDAALVLGYIDPGFFLGGRLRLDVEAAHRAVARDIAGPLAIPVEAAAASILTLATERMVGAIEDVTVNRGIDPAGAVIVAGGGSAGLNAVAIARRLGVTQVIVPSVGATLSAAGALMSDLTAEYRALAPVISTRYADEPVRAALADLAARCADFARRSGAVSSEVRFAVEARYVQQAWDIEVPLSRGSTVAPDFLDTMVADFHRRHDELFAVSDPASPIEFLTWIARVSCRLSGGPASVPRLSVAATRVMPRRAVYFAECGWCDADVRGFGAWDGELAGPAIVESDSTTVVLPPGSSAHGTAQGSLLINTRVEEPGLDRQD